MYEKEFEILEKWIDVNFPKLLENPKTKIGKSVSYQSQNGEQFYLIYLIETKELYMTNEFDAFFKNTFGTEYTKYFGYWFEDKTKNEVKSIL